MSEKSLLARFDLVADNPENMPLLRHYIVDLAIRGKLLEKSALDISASEMLNRIEAKAGSLVKQGKLKKQKPLAPISAEELPATYIAHCTFERLGNVASLQKGLTGIQRAMPGEFPLVVTAATRSSCDHYDFDGAAAIVPMVSSTGHGHASLNRLHYQEGKFALGTILCAVFPIDEELISARFLFEYLTAFKDDLLVSKMNGTANVTLTVSKIAEVPVPIIAPAVQRRVDELMALCDQLESAKNEREAQRDRLVAASLHRIGTVPATEAEAATAAQSASPLRQVARFHLHHLPRLTTRPEHIKQLRQTILNLAVRGRLVPQDPSDEPAVELLKRIKVEKARLMKEGLIPRSKASAGVAELTYSLPSNWLAIRFDDVCNLVTSGSRGWAEYYADSGPKFVRAQNIRFGCLRLDDLACVNPPAKSEGKRTQVTQGDILVVITGAGVTNPALMDRDIGEAYVSQHVALIKPTETALSRWLLLSLMAGPGGRDELVERAYGAGKPGLNLDNLRTLTTFLPPLAEQHRIVAKVDELMALCDQLETQLTTTQNDSRRLLEAVLHQALSPRHEEVA